MDKMVGRRQLPCVRRLGSLHRDRVILWCGANVDGKKKSDEEAKKKQRMEQAADA
jgi:hypothetical protein